MQSFQERHPEPGENVSSRLGEVFNRTENGAGREGGGRKRYVTKQLTVEELAAVPPEEKERQGYVIQELSVSKLALTAL